jgi:hypothetical protein
MEKEIKDIVKSTIKDLFDLQEKVRDFKINNDFILSLAQLDFFKVISSIVIGIISIGYFYNQNLNLNEDFLFTSLLLSVAILVTSISYTRESIDLQFKLIQKIYETVEEQTESGIEVCIKTVDENNPNIFFEYAREKVKKEIKSESALNYIGEIVVFLFYLSIGFLAMSFLSIIHNFTFFSFQTLFVILIAYFLSFKDWAVKCSEFFSKKIKLKKYLK